MSSKAAQLGFQVDDDDMKLKKVSDDPAMFLEHKASRQAGGGGLALAKGAGGGRGRVWASLHSSAL